MSELKKVYASWYAKLSCDCPHCDYHIYIDSEIRDSFEWIYPIQSRENVNQEIVCPECKEAFLITNIEY